MRTQLTIKAMLCGTVFCAMTATPAVLAQTAESAVMTLDQGANWTETDRANFYSQDQGSQIMPLAWFRALKQPDGQPFLADSLSRYGYLPNPANTNGLPIGFTASGPEGLAFAGMTCSACHTRQITADGKEYRIDGGPAIVDWQSFSTDLDAAVDRVLHNEADFQAFAAAVLGPSAPQPDDVKTLRENLQLWYARYNAWVGSLPRNAPWGPGRMDAVGMIFNRLTGLDIGPPPSLLIKGNIQKAEAPVRYPFLWNAPKQNRTQWAGFAPNGNDIFALNRNLGQVYGVYGVFEPKKMHLPGTNIPIPGLIDYLRNNSANFNGLNKLENLVKKIPSPKWPWGFNEPLRTQGEAIYKWPKERGGCVECHGLPSAGNELWEAPVQKVGTDSKQMALFERQADTGELDGAIMLFDGTLKETDAAIRVLTASVLGTIIQKYLPVTGQSSQTDLTIKFQPPPPLRVLKEVIPGAESMLQKMDAGQDLGGRDLGGQSSGGKYEARVLYGIWAAAPYLHNGSVPSLAELLKPAKERVASFKVGPAYDKENVGLAADQPKFNFTLDTTDCDKQASGNSRCGHEYGTTQLKPDEKKALLEYLKTL
jgi:hypothetical protein